jgi:hypothetical protein
MTKQLFAAATGFAVAAAFSISAAAQTPQTTPPTTSPQTSSPAQPAQDRAEAQQVTLVGCVQSEADYRKAHDLGRGGAVGTGAGVGNEFVLTNASATGGAMAGSPTGTGTATGTAGTATGTSGASATAAFEITGENESKLAQYVGQRVEITGKLKKAEVGPAGATGGAPAGTPPTGVDMTSPDLKLREVEIVSVRTTSGTCPAK